MSTRNIVFIPSVKPGNGTGHLRRCLQISQHINTTASHDGGDVRSSVLIENRAENLPRTDLIAGLFPEVPVVSNMDASSWDAIVLDRRSTDRETVNALKNHGPIIGLDEGGDSREMCDYLIDTPMSGDRYPEPNEIAFPFACSLKRPTILPDRPQAILVTFGGEDPAGLTPATCVSLIMTFRVPPASITAVRGPSAPHWKLPEGVQTLVAPESLHELLPNYDLVITSYGLTAYEALISGTGVLLVNPSKYHDALSHRAGFALARTGRLRGRWVYRSLRRLPLLVGKLELAKRHLYDAGWRPEHNGFAMLAKSLGELRFHGRRTCRVCGGRTIDVARFPGKSFARCASCGIVSLSSFGAGDTSYGESYFFEEYKSQYGKTYLDDFDNIRKLSAPRLDIIARFCAVGSSLLDVGCAYGPFLTEARSRGHRCYGIDIAGSAVEYVSNTLGIPAVSRDFGQLDPAESFSVDKFGVIAMWYVLEHFKNPDAILRQVSQLLEHGGVFAFSTPNSRGISGLTGLNSFLRRSPEDHYTVWSPRIARRVLKSHGFSVKKIRITGHHPERFPGMRGSTKVLISPILRLASRFLGLGDTFEVYAVKKGGAE